jgi:hypothetical protein
MIRLIQYLPFISLLSFAIFVLIIKVTYGYLPSYGHPDAGNFKGIFLYLDIFVFCMALLATFSLPLQFYLHYKSKAIQGPLKFYYITYLVLILMIYFDFWGFVD